jgi:hypothetical protein
MPDDVPNFDVDTVVSRIWAWNEATNNFARLRIDEFLIKQSNEKSRRPIVHPLPDAQRLTRRAMEVGLYDILLVRSEDPTPIAKDFQSLATKANSAFRKLDGFLKHLDGGAKSAADLVLPILTSQAGIRKGSAQELYESAKADATTLWHTREILLRLEKTADSKELRVRHGKQNPGKPEHRVFTKNLAEMWVFLTGTKPGVNPNRKNNPFLRFVTTAWSDVFGDGQDDNQHFIGALRGLTWTESQILVLKQHGPPWRLVHGREG